MRELTLEHNRKWRSRVQSSRRIVNPLYLAWRKQRELKLVLDRTKRIGGSDILLFATVRNEEWRLPFFLDYYRKLGVRHFLFVDNGSTDNLQNFLKEQPDCSCWYTQASYKNSNFGMHWLNALLRKYGAGHWCVTCDPDEFLVFPHCEERNLNELVEFLTNENRDHLFCLLLDMYGKGAVRDASCARGQSPLEVAPFFDSMGYVQNPQTYHGDVYVQGGVRRRVFFSDSPQRAPALNKTPLIFWKRHYAYVSSMHVTNIVRLNRPHKFNHMSPTGCILHFKFLAAIVEKASEEMQRKQHYDNSIEYRSYHDIFSAGQDSFYCEVSAPYAGSKDLIERGLMNRGQWF
jgi:hypothetical protein